MVAQSCVRVRVRVRACTRVCVPVCVHACVHMPLCARVRVSVHGLCRCRYRHHARVVAALRVTRVFTLQQAEAAAADTDDDEPIDASELGCSRCRYSPQARAPPDSRRVGFRAEAAAQAGSGRGSAGEGRAEDR